MTGRKKLIEVALPLEAINEASRREKSPFTRNHPRALHKWWAPRPLAACRAVLFASIVDDPSSRPEAFPTEEAQNAERERLFRIIEELVKWENSSNERVLEQAREEIRKATGGSLPAVTTARQSAPPGVGQRRALMDAFKGSMDSAMAYETAPKDQGREMGPACVTDRADVRPASPTGIGRLWGGRSHAYR